jgi:hypothetical protein
MRQTYDGGCLRGTLRYRVAGALCGDRLFRQKPLLDRTLKIQSSPDPAFRYVFRLFSIQTFGAHGLVVMIRMRLPDLLLISNEPFFTGMPCNNRMIEVSMASSLIRYTVN